MDTFPEPPTQGYFSGEAGDAAPSFSPAMQKALQRLALIAYAVQEVHYELDYPETPDEKAELLISVENLAVDVLDLVSTTRTYVWGLDYENQTLPEDR